MRYVYEMKTCTCGTLQFAVFLIWMLNININIHINTNLASHSELSNNLLILRNHSNCTLVLHVSCLTTEESFHVDFSYVGRSNVTVYSIQCNNVTQLFTSDPTNI
jgi:hypothetical protein